MTKKYPGLHEASVLGQDGHHKQYREQTDSKKGGS